MDKTSRIELYHEAFLKWGKEKQVNMIYEEIGELLTALSRFKRGRANHSDIMTELADVSIMIEQIAAFINYEDFEKEKDYKLNRLKDKIDNGDNN